MPEQMTNSVAQDPSSDLIAQLPRMHHNLPQAVQDQAVSPLQFHERHVQPLTQPVQLLCPDVGFLGRQQKEAVMSKWPASARIDAARQSGIGVPTPLPPNSARAYKTTPRRSSRPGSRTPPQPPNSARSRKTTPRPSWNSEHSARSRSLPPTSARADKITPRPSFNSDQSTRSPSPAPSSAWAAPPPSVNSDAAPPSKPPSSASTGSRTPPRIDEC